MIFRPQRGGLDESMAALVFLTASKESLAEYLGEPAKDIAVRAYADDRRINWPNTHLVTVRGQAVGFTNQEVL